MKVYVFGNEDVKEDSIAIEIAHDLDGKLENVHFIYVKPNEDLSLNEPEMYIMDVVKGISTVRILDESFLDKLKNPPRYSSHDFDLAFQLKYLKKLGKINNVSIIGLSYGTEINKKIKDEVKNILIELNKNPRD